MNILFVCTGNTCRSPMAEALFNREIERRLPGHAVTAASAGLAAFAGMPASSGAQAAMAEAGISISEHRARPIDQAMAEAADLILTMTAAHAAQLKLYFPEAAAKCFPYADYLNRRAAGSGGGPSFRDVSDPFGGDAQIYGACAGQLKGMTEVLADTLAADAVSSDADPADTGSADDSRTDAGLTIFE